MALAPATLAIVLVAFATPVSAQITAPRAISKARNQKDYVARIDAAEQRAQTLRDKVGHSPKSKARTLKRLRHASIVAALMDGNAFARKKALAVSLAAFEKEGDRLAKAPADEGGDVSDGDFLAASHWLTALNNPTFEVAAGDARTQERVWRILQGARALNGGRIGLHRDPGRILLIGPTDLPWFREIMTVLREGGLDVSVKVR